MLTLVPFVAASPSPAVPVTADLVLPPLVTPPFCLHWIIVDGGLTTFSRASMRVQL
jgi:hypothetical protein